MICPMCSASSMDPVNTCTRVRIDRADGRDLRQHHSIFGMMLIHMLLENRYWTDKQVLHVAGQCQVPVEVDMCGITVWLTCLSRRRNMTQG